MSALRKLRRAARNTLLTAHAGITGDHTRLDFRKAMANIPLLLTDKTYNTAHPDYDASLVSNYPGLIYGTEFSSSHPLYADIRRMAIGKKVPQLAWKAVLAMAMREASTVPGFEQVMERKAYIE